MSEKTMRDNTHIIQEKELIIRMLHTLIPGVKIYLYGSRARGTHDVMSDIDLALDAGRKLTQLEIIRAKGVLEGLWIPQRFDVIDLNAISGSFKENVLRDKIEWDRFETKIISSSSVKTDFSKKFYCSQA
jgi:uncharacterized protein